ncbi:MAG: glutaminyl-peptide cyclotransferase [Polyangiales bacterium]
MAPASRRHHEGVARADLRTIRTCWLATLGAALLAVGVADTSGCRDQAPETVTPVDIHPAEASLPTKSPGIEELRVRVVARYPHSTNAFTQGLIWHDGYLYESTGQYGQSSLRKVRLQDGKVLTDRKLDRSLFGEGLALVGDRLIQLTWRAGIAIVSDLATLEERETLRYPGEGWGLCYDGAALVMTDGSSTLEFRDPDSMELLREVTVLKNGRPVRQLNELECVGGDVYANIWQREEILRIDPKTGHVSATIDASGLLSPAEATRADVLNGIAYKPESQTFLLTGKLWPQVFEVELEPR